MVFLETFRRLRQQISILLRSAIAVAGVAILGAAPIDGAVAEGDPPAIGIELNRLEQSGTACRLSLVFTNRLSEAVSVLTIEMVVFDNKGSVQRFLVLKSKPLTPRKVRVQQFDVSGLNCASVGRILLNDVKKCKAGAMDATACLARIRPSSRAGVPFFSTTAN